MRIKIIRVIISILFMILGVSLFYIQVIRGNYFHSLSVNNRIRVVPLEGRRGRILDRNGVVLADNRLSFDVSVIPQDIKESDELFDYLSEKLNIDKKKLLQRFFKKKITPFAPVVIADDVDKRVAMIIEENKFRFPGLYVRESFRRSYSFGEVGSHILGYVGNISHSRINKLKDYGYTPQSIVGYSGIEEFYDSYLIGTDGGQQIEVNSHGHQVRLLSVREPQRGQDIQLTIDSRIQSAAAEALKDNNGTIIVMDLNTGGILGMVSSPVFDPNKFVTSKNQGEINEYFLDSTAPLLNRAIKGLYPPGSVFKVVGSVAGLATKKIDLDTTFFCKGSYKLGRSRFRCAHVHGEQGLVEAIGHSCNVYFYNLGMLLGPDTLNKYARILGFGSKTNIDIPFEEEGSVPGKIQRRVKYNKAWYDGDTLNFSIGQGDLLVTPLQTVIMMATVARGGKVASPHLIKAIGGKSVVAFPTEKSVKLKKGIYETVQEGLRSAVSFNDGTARLLDIDGFEISGKTGTSQTTRGKNNHAWFVGYNKQSQPDFAFCVFLEYGGSSYYATRVARKMLKQLRKENIL